MHKTIVIGHERSGNHFLLNSLSKNFGYKPIENSILGNGGELYDKIMGTTDNILIKSHHHFDFYQPIWNSLKDKVYLFYVVRDFRDVITSCWYYFNRVKRPKLFPICKNVGGLIYTNPCKYTFHEAYSNRKPASMLNRWLEHIVSWKGIYVVRYENLVYNFNNEMEKIGKILNKKPTYIKPLVSERGVANRKGVVGDWKNHMTERDSREIIKRIGNQYGRDFIV